jgi:hypothetical protein
MLLERHGVHDVYANYWIAYRVTFETGGATDVTPFSYDRYPPLARTVAGAARPAYLFVPTSATPGRFEAWCAAHAVAVQVWHAGGFTVVWPVLRMLPSAVPGPVLQ